MLMFLTLLTHVAPLTCPSKHLFRWVGHFLTFCSCRWDVPLRKVSLTTVRALYGNFINMLRFINQWLSFFTTLFLGS